MDEMTQCMVAKFCKVKAMGLAEYHELRGFPAPEKDQKGLLVLLDGPKNHPDYDGYITWWPANLFEKSLFQITSLVLY